MLKTNQIEYNNMADDTIFDHDLLIKIETANKELLKLTFLKREQEFRILEME